MQPKTKSTQKTNTLEIDFSDAESTNFKEDHLSFHESGYIGSRNNKQKRYSNGIIGIPFSQIKSNLFILVIAPKNPSDMIESSKLDPTRDIHIDLPDNVQPFAMD